MSIWGDDTASYADWFKDFQKVSREISQTLGANASTFNLIQDTTKNVSPITKAVDDFSAFQRIREQTIPSGLNMDGLYQDFNRLIVPYSDEFKSYQGLTNYFIESAKIPLINTLSLIHI